MCLCNASSPISDGDLYSVQWKSPIRKIFYSGMQNSLCYSILFEVILLHVAGDCWQQYLHATYPESLKNEMKSHFSKPYILFSLP